MVHSWGDGGLYDHRFAYDDLLRETSGGMSRATPEWRARYGPASMREHHLIPQAMMKDQKFHCSASFCRC
ncbi:hypothetical protein CKY51_03795 [Xanthomonas maliensis]|nr:hypothetical protein CKY51_03795 [Xanthomonas maliensis]